MRGVHIAILNQLTLSTFISHVTNTTTTNPGMSTSRDEGGCPGDTSEIHYSSLEFTKSTAQVTGLKAFYSATPDTSGQASYSTQRLQGSD